MRPPFVAFVLLLSVVGAGACGSSNKKKTAKADEKPPLVLPGQAAAFVFPPKAELLALIQARVEQKRASGIVLGVREADGTHTIVAYGDPGPERPALGAKSVFEIGSISKVFTGILLADMSLRGEVGLEDPVQKYAHQGVNIPSKGKAPIRLVDLATHTSGLPRMPTNFTPADPNNPYADYTVEALHDFLSNFELERDVGEEHEYSNLGVGLLAHVLAAKADSDWESLVKNRILQPLYMSMSGVTLSPEMQSLLALGHDAEGHVVSNWDLPTLAGAGALRSNAEDMLRFIDANLALDSETALAKAMRLSHVPREPAGPGMQVGLNWFTSSSDKGTIVWHNGGTGGYRSFVAFDAERQVGVVLLENSTHGCDDIALHLLDPSIPLAKPPRSFHQVEISPELLADYVGLYALSPTFQMRVTLEGGRLMIQATGQEKIAAYPFGDAEFFLKIVDAQLTFERDTAGVVKQLILHQGGVDQVAAKIE